MQRLPVLASALLAFALLVSGAVAGADVIEGVASDGPALQAPAVPVQSDPMMLNVFINFDDQAEPCVFLDTNPLRDRYQALGVLFSGPSSLDGGAILDQCGGFGVSGHSAPNFLAFNCGAGMMNGGTPRGPETLTFSPAVTTVSILAGSGSGSGSTLSMDAFDAGNQPLGSDSITLSNVLQPMMVQAAGIDHVVIGTTGPCVYVLDDLTFDFGATPVESGTWGTIKALYR